MSPPLLDVVRSVIDGLRNGGMGKLAAAQLLQAALPDSPREVELADAIAEQCAREAEGHVNRITASADYWRGRSDAAAAVRRLKGKL